MSRNRILITAVAAALLVVCGIGIFFASNRDHAAERADEWTMQGMTLAPDGSATPCTVRIAGTSRSYLLGGRVGAFETGTDGGIYVDGTRVCSNGFCAHGFASASGPTKQEISHLRGFPSGRLGMFADINDFLRDDVPFR